MIVIGVLKLEIKSHIFRTISIIPLPHSKMKPRPDDKCSGDPIREQPEIQDNQKSKKPSKEDYNDNFEANCGGLKTHHLEEPPPKKPKIADYDDDDDGGTDAKDKRVLRRSSRLSGNQNVLFKDPSFVLPSPSPRISSKTPGKVRSKTRKRSNRSIEKSLATSLPQDPPSLTTLPGLVHQKLLTYLDVQSMESLSKTCSVFDILINGQYLTAVNIPHDVDFYKEIRKTGFDVKPILKLQSKKNYPVDYFIADWGKFAIDYIINTQLSMLVTTSLREIDLVPFNAREGMSALPAPGRIRYPYNELNSSTKEKLFELDSGILHELANTNSLKHVSRLSLMTSHRSHQNCNFSFLSSFLQTHIPNLQEVEIFASPQPGL